MTIRKNAWNTYAIYGYTSDVANHRASQGGVHLHQVRHHPGGGWQKRIVQSNGRHEAAGPVQSIDDREGWALFATAQQEAGR
jgi:hypothetical protein